MNTRKTSPRRVVGEAAGRLRCALRLGEVQRERFEPGCRDRSADSRHGTGDAFLASAIDDDPGAFGRQSLGDGKADPSR